MALLLNLSDFRLPARLPLVDGGLVIEAAWSIIDVVEDPASTRSALQSARDLADGINKGHLLPHRRRGRPHP